jgi:hypothetical protein
MRLHSIIVTFHKNEAAGWTEERLTHMDASQAPGNEASLLIQKRVNTGCLFSKNNGVGQSYLPDGAAVGCRTLYRPNLVESAHTANRTLKPFSHISSLVKCIWNHSGKGLFWATLPNDGSLGRGSRKELDSWQVHGDDASMIQPDTARLHESFTNERDNKPNPPRVYGPSPSPDS